MPKQTNSALRRPRPSISEALRRSSRKPLKRWADAASRRLVKRATALEAVRQGTDQTGLSAAIREAQAHGDDRIFRQRTVLDGIQLSRRRQADLALTAHAVVDPTKSAIRIDRARGGSSSEVSSITVRRMSQGGDRVAGQSLRNNRCRQLRRKYD